MRSRSKSVAYGPGTAFLKKDAPDAAEIQKLEAAHVHFVACGNAMKKQHLEAADLVAGVDVVPAGIVEVVRKQGSRLGLHQGRSLTSLCPARRELVRFQ